MTTREDCIAAAGRAHAAAISRRDGLTPRQAALEAHRPGGPTVDELERLIREQRREAHERAHTDASQPTG